MSRKILISSDLTKFIATPLRPKRPDLPMLNMNNNRNKVMKNTPFTNIPGQLTGECKAHGYLVSHS